MRGWIKDRKGLPEVVAPASQGAMTKPPVAGLPWENERVKAILGDAAFANRNKRGLVFAIDATGSRAPTWNIAMKVQAEMFSGLTQGLKVQLVYYRGTEFKVSKWTDNPKGLADEMCGVACHAGATQIESVLTHAYRSAPEEGIAALVFVGDAMEERSEVLICAAKKLASRNVKAFMFQEGDVPAVAAVFKEIATLTKGAHCTFGHNSASELSDLLSAVAAFATGGVPALQQLAHRPGAQLLLRQLK